MGKIKYLIMDVDGTLTDGRIVIGCQGELFKCFHVKDGYGIHEILPIHGIVPVIFTGRESEIVKIRCRELGIYEVYQGVKNKAEKLSSFLNLHNVTAENIAYIGDDLNDLDVMCTIKESGGIVGCPQDASKGIKEIADFVCTLDGGRGAVREFIDFLCFG